MPDYIILSIGGAMIFVGILLSLILLKISNITYDDAKMLYAFKNLKRGDRNSFISDLTYKMSIVNILMSICGLIVVLFVIL